MRSASRFGPIAAVLLLVSLPATQAVLFQSTADPSYNTTEPGGALTNRGWRLEGFWSSYLGTPVAPTFFVAAKHIGGNVGDLFVLNGFTYHTTGMFSSPSGDLIVWQVAETFPTYASLYTNTDEVGRHCFVFGRGTQRGPAVIVGGVTNGWQWGAVDGAKRWGENDVSSATSGLLRAAFNRNGGTNECDLSVGDSSGAMFIEAGGEWKLAGIHYAVDGPFSNATYGVINAALVDRGGLCETDGSCYNNVGTDSPSGFYSTRISSQAAWIKSVIHFEPGIDLQITGVNFTGDDVQITFMTGLNKIYRLDSAQTPGAWTTITNGIVGTGGIVSVIDFGAAALPQRFYRVGLVP